MPEENTEESLVDLLSVLIRYRKAILIPTILIAVVMLILSIGPLKGTNIIDSLRGPADYTAIVHYTLPPFTQVWPLEIRGFLFVQLRKYGSDPYFLRDIIKEFTHQYPELKLVSGDDDDDDDDVMIDEIQRKLRYNISWEALSFSITYRSENAETSKNFLTVLLQHIRDDYYNYLVTMENDFNNFIISINETRATEEPFEDTFSVLFASEIVKKFIAEFDIAWPNLEVLVTSDGKDIDVQQEVQQEVPQDTISISSLVQNVVISTVLSLFVFSCLAFFLNYVHGMRQNTTARKKIKKARKSGNN